MLKVDATNLHCQDFYTVSIFPIYQRIFHGTMWIETNIIEVIEAKIKITDILNRYTINWKYVKSISF